MLKDKIERKTINHKQKGSNEKKKKLKNKDQIERKKTNQRMDNFGFKG